MKSTLFDIVFVESVGDNSLCLCLTKIVAEDERPEDVEWSYSTFCPTSIIESNKFEFAENYRDLKIDAALARRYLGHDMIEALTPDEQVLVLYRRASEERLNPMQAMSRVPGFLPILTFVDNQEMIDSYGHRYFMEQWKKAEEAGIANQSEDKLFIHLMNSHEVDFYLEHQDLFGPFDRPTIAKPYKVEVVSEDFDKAG